MLWFWIYEHFLSEPHSKSARHSEPSRGSYFSLSHTKPLRRDWGPYLGTMLRQGCLVSAFQSAHSRPQSAFQPLWDSKTFVCVSSLRHISGHSQALICGSPWALKTHISLVITLLHVLLSRSCSRRAVFCSIFLWNDRDQDQTLCLPRPTVAT